MDTTEKGHRPEAARLLNGWLERSADHAGLALLPLFLSLRAVIRAKVVALAATRAGGESFAQAADQARQYLTLGHDLLTPPPPRLVAIGGPSGTGKTSLARRAAPDIPGPAPGAVVLRTDVTRKELFGRPAGERLPPDAYTPEVSARVFATIAERAATTLRAGYSVVADGVYGSPEQRAAIEAVAAAQGLPFHGFWLDAPLPILERRVAARRGDASDADAAVVRRQVETIDAGSVAWRRVAADGPLDAVAAEIADELGHRILGSPVP